MRTGTKTTTPATSTTSGASKPASSSSSNRTLAQNLAKVTDPKHVPKEYKDQFLKKIQFCSNQYDLNDENKHIKEKNERLQYLQELSELLNEPNCFTSIIIPHLDLVMEMI
jgi:serine/threonine-protein phosphatase 2A regulatory subunit B'